MIPTEKYISSLEAIVRAGLRHDGTALSAFEELCAAHEESRLSGAEAKDHFLRAIEKLVASVNCICADATVGISPPPLAVLPHQAMTRPQFVPSRFEVLKGGKPQC